MWQRGDITVMKNVPSLVRRTLVACVRSERGASTAESVSAAMEVAGPVEGVW